jgi:predicted DNA-binding transcriptional regulator AlpA
MTEHDQLVSKRDTAERCRVSTRTLERWAQMGIGPTPLKIGPAGLVRYWASEVERWLDQCRRA